MCCTNSLFLSNPSTMMLRKGQIPNVCKSEELHWGQLNCVTILQLRTQSLDLAGFWTMTMFTFNFILFLLKNSGTAAVLLMPVLFFAAGDGCKPVLALVSVWFSSLFFLKETFSLLISINDLYGHSLNGFWIWSDLSDLSSFVSTMTFSYTLSCSLLKSVYMPDAYPK